ncbi:CdaR family transcriptional regulator [Bacillus oleivorans]|uniref:CdaR family transcriptional regulator n=1 Tax=Bacillus oleivorans TaxID=1448271 RepID=A0A285D487_9BACI|nr:sugar diacid recognition domain-containing protein [Bacillus oleivorans]SNX74108.1 CdaR family transcriptional regulator [Bacillus oleivorans]
MLLNEGLAQKIVIEVQKLINESVILTDIEGIIRASTDPSRIGNFHEGALLAIQEKKAIHMTEEKVKSLRGVKFGIVIPLFMHGKPQGVIGITGIPEVVAPYAHLLQKVTELFIQDNAYREEQERLARELELFVFDWLHTKIWDQDLIDRAAFFQIDMYSFQQVIVFKSMQEPFKILYSDFKEIIKLWGVLEDALIIRWGQEKLLVFIPLRTQSIKKQEVESLRKILKRFTKGKLLAGVGQVVNPVEIKVSFQQAERAGAAAAEAREIVYEQDLQFDIIQYAISDETKQEFIQRTIQPICSDEILLKTLRIWFECNLSHKEAAKDLHIHINTLHYRLKKIEDLTALNLKNTHHLVMLYISYLFLYKDTKNSRI